MVLESLKFGNYLREERIRKNISQDELCDAIADRTLIGKIESGMRYPDKMLRDRLLSRLGQGGYDYECFLQFDDYEHWKLRDLILTNLNERNLENARKLLEKYKNKYAVTNISVQFYLTMMVQLMEHENKNPKDIFEVLCKAVALTMPDIDDKFIADKRFAPQEINLILEFFSYKFRLSDNAGKFADECSLIMKYVRTAGFDKDSYSILLAKCAYYYCDSRLREKRPVLHEILDVCNEGIESIRECRRGYYLFELLDTKLKIITNILNTNSDLTFEEKKAYESEYKQTEWYFYTFKEIYDDYKVPVKMCNYVHFYWEMNVFCINDVIRARRKTLGISQKSLSDICTVKTLQRIENKKSRVQLMLAQELFKRFNLSMEMQRADIETSDTQAVRLEKEFRRACNSKKFDDAKIFLDQLTKLISMDNVLNRQYIEVGNANIRYGLKQIGRAEYVEKLKKALSLTVQYDIAVKLIDYKNKRANEKYLSNMETTIFLQCSIIFGKDKDNPFAEQLIDVFKYYKNVLGVTSNIAQKDVIFSHIGSYLGNIGEYQRSNEMSEEIILNELRHCRLSDIELNIHSIMWNYDKCGSTEKKRMWLLQCLAINSFCKIEKRFKKVRGEIENLSTLS